jgi:ABC-type multidrug transport system fused ATPase/permease subunit
MPGNALQPLLAVSFGEFLWSLLIIFFMVTFFVILFHVVFDIFRSDDLSGGSKALWVIFIVVLPFLGLLVYLIARGDKMQRRQLRAAEESQAAFDDYVRSVAGGPAGEIAHAKELLDAGTISEEEFQQIKQKALG